MNLVTKVTGVGVSAVLVVGLMGMSQASGDHSASTGTHDGAHGVVGATGGALSEAKVDRQRAKGTLPRLFGRVDADRSITISQDPVPSGRYRLIVRDTTTGHNWHIFRDVGDGVDRATTVNGTGRWAWTVRLRDGTYTVRCDIHTSSMKFTLNVT